MVHLGRESQQHNRSPFNFSLAIHFQNCFKRQLEIRHLLKNIRTVFVKPNEFNFTYFCFEKLDWPTGTLKETLDKSS